MAKINQKISGNHNIQVAGNYITTPKVVVKHEVKYDPNIHINNAQAKQIKDRVDEIMLSIAAERKKNEYGKLWNALKNKFNVSSYHVITKDQFDDVMKFLSRINVSYYRGKLRKNDNLQWRNGMYKSIYARSNSLNWSKEQLYDYVSKVLELKTPICSMSELSDTRLKKVYDQIFSKRI
jgi:hypothetical protein